MKRLANHNNLLVFFYGFLIGSIIFVFVLPDSLYVITYCDYWRWLALGMLIVGPWGNRRLGTVKHLSWWPLLIRIFSLQLLLFITYLTTTYFLKATYLPTAQLDLSEVMVHYSWYWPFILMAALTLSLIYSNHHYHHNHNGMYSVIVEPIIDNKPYDGTSIVLNVLPRTAIMGWFMLIGSLIILSTATLVTHIYVGINVYAIIAAQTVIVVNNSQLAQKWQRLLLKQSMSPQVQFLLATLTLSGAFILTNLLLAMAIPTISAPLKAILNYQPAGLMGFAENHAFTLFWLSFWSAMAPLLIAVIHYCFQGYTIRQTVSAMLFLPITVSILSNVELPVIEGHRTVMALGVLTCSTMMVSLFVKKHYAAHLFRGVLPGATNYTTPGPSPLLNRAINLMVISLFLVAPFGPKAFGLIILGMGFPLYVTSFASFYYLFIAMNRGPTPKTIDKGDRQPSSNLQRTDLGTSSTTQ